jgi:adenosine deaminase
MAIQDQKIMDAISENDIVLEICPTSNLKNSKTKDLEEFSHIVKTFLKNNVKMTLNTD